MSESKLTRGGSISTETEGNGADLEHLADTTPFKSAPHEEVVFHPEDKPDHHDESPKKSTFTPIHNSLNLKVPPKRAGKKIGAKSPKMV